MCIRDSGNIDATIIAQKPKMAPHIPQMRANMAKAMGINESQLNIKATTEEKQMCIRDRRRALPEPADWFCPDPQIPVCA